MLLDQFTKSKTQIALSNVANGRKATTPLLSTIFKYGKPAKTTAVELVYDSATGKVLPLADRNNSNNKIAGNTQGKKTRHAKTINAMHVTTFAEIDSDEIQDIPEPTSPQTLEQFNKYVQGEVWAMEESLEATREFHAMGSLKGKVKDTDGTVVYDLHQTLGLSAPTVTNITPTKIDEADGFRIFIHDAKARAKAKLKGKVIKGFVALCGANAYKECAFSSDAKEDMATMKLKYVTEGFSDGFNIYNVDFVEYDGGIGEDTFINPDEILLLPIVDGLYKVVPTPGKGTNLVNKKGQKTYITTKELDHNLGAELKGQSNYVVYVEVPDAIQQLTVKAA